IAIVVDGLAPLGVAIGEVMRGELPEIIAVRPKVVVNHVENNAESAGVRAVHEIAKIVGCSVKMTRSEPVYAIVPPAESTRELGDRHNLDYSHAKARELRKLDGGRCEGSFFGEGAEVHLIDDLSMDLDTAPQRVGPLEAGWIDDHRRSV